MAARFCPQCGKEISSAARFCPHCGASLAAGAAANPNVTRMDTAARSTRRLVLPLVVAVLVVLAVAVAVLANKLHQDSLLAARSNQIPGMPLTNTPLQPLAAPPLTNAPTHPLSAPPLTNAPTQPAAPAQPMTNAPTTGPGKLPADVAAYLAFLQGIEEKRVELDNDPALMSGLNAAISGSVNSQQEQNEMNGLGLGDGDSSSGNAPAGNTTGSQLSQPFTVYENAWQDLIAKFRAQAAPQPCTLLASKYQTFLDDDFAGVVQVHVGILNKMSSTASNANNSGAAADDPSNWISAKKKNDAEGLAADGALSNLCQNYNAPKPFSIEPEGSSSSLLGM